jgi:hypothetical protein
MVRFGGKLLENYDFGIAWEWEYDKDFINLVRLECQRQEISFLSVHPKNFEEISNKVEKREISFSAYLDRAGDALEHFAKMTEKLRGRGTWVLNRIREVVRSRDKATMHLDFITKGLYVPFSVILSPYEKDPELRVSELEKLGRPFIIKPANGGGGLGVVMGAENLWDVIEARKEFRQDKYLLQRKIIPRTLGSQRAWFRSFYVCGKVISCWWNDLTHIYDIITPEDRAVYRLYKLKDITKSIAEVCALNFFSTEIALDDVNDRYTVVDYVNEPCDMRFKSLHPDGVPDIIAVEIIQAILSGVKNHLRVQKKLIRN